MGLVAPTGPYLVLTSNCYHQNWGYPKINSECILVAGVECQDGVEDLLEVHSVTEDSRSTVEYLTRLVVATEDTWLKV